jgi:hypothetical protein
MSYELSMPDIGELSGRDMLRSKLSRKNKRAVYMTK